MLWRNFGVWSKVSSGKRGKYRYFWRYLKFLITQCRIGLTPKKISPIRSAISIEHRLVTSRHRQTQGHSYSEDKLSITRWTKPAPVNQTLMSVETSWQSRILLDVLSTLRYCRTSGMVIRRSARVNRRPDQSPRSHNGHLSVTSRWRSYWPAQRDDRLTGWLRSRNKYPAACARHGTGSHFVTQWPSDLGIQRPGDPVDPVTLFYNELQMSTYVKGCANRAFYCSSILSSILSSTRVLDKVSK